jgi:hypothetical protein
MSKKRKTNSVQEKKKAKTKAKRISNEEKEVILNLGASNIVETLCKFNPEGGLDSWGEDDAGIQLYNPILKVCFAKKKK